MRWFLVALLLPAFTANAEMFKCVDPDGNVSFQGEPCPDNQVTEWQRETEQQKKERVQPRSTSPAATMSGSTSRPTRARAASAGTWRSPIRIAATGPPTPRS